MSNLFGSHFAQNSIHAFFVVINGFLSGQFISIVGWESKLAAAKQRIVQDHAVIIDRTHRYERRSTFRFVPRPYSLLSKSGVTTFSLLTNEPTEPEHRQITWVSFKLPWKGSTRKLRKIDAVDYNVARFKYFWSTCIFLNVTFIPLI